MCTIGRESSLIVLQQAEPCCESARPSCARRRQCAHSPPP